MAQSQENLSSSDTGERLRRLVPKILEHWESDVRKQLPIVQLYESSLLRNTLPVFLGRLARALDGPRSPEAPCGDTQISEEHGRDRAKLAHYSVEQVLEEYRLLRRRVVKNLQASGPLSFGEMECINGAFEQAGIDAVGAFARQLRQTKQALKESEGRFRTLVEQAPFPVSILKGPELTYEVANAAEVELVGRGPLAGRRLTEVFPEAQFAAAIHRVKEVYRTGQTFTAPELRVVTPEAGGETERIFHVVYQPLRDEHGAVDGVVAFSVDVTALVQARRATERQEKKLHAILDRMPIPVVLIEPGSGKYLFSNRMAQKMYGGGVPEDVAEEGSAHCLVVEDLNGRRITSEDFPSSRAARGEILDGDEVVWHSNTGRYHITLYSELVTAGDGSEPVVVLPFLDITRLKETERALGQALEARNELISFIGHELRTPLTGLLLQLQLMEHLAGRKPAEGLSAEVLERSLQPAIRQATRLQQLIDRLLDLSRIQNNRLQLEVSAVDLCALVGEVVQRLSYQAKLAGSDLRLVGCKELFAYLDPLRIEQVIGNLVTNAVKYGARKPVEVNVYEQGEEAVIEVRDFGIGISAEDRGRIFQRFERATEAKRGESLGIGLYISNQIVRAHGGRFEIESELGRGTLFRVVLPAKRIETSILP